MFRGRAASSIFFALPAGAIVGAQGEEILAQPRGNALAATFSSLESLDENHGDGTVSTADFGSDATAGGLIAAICVLSFLLFVALRKLTTTAKASPFMGGASKKEAEELLLRRNNPWTMEWDAADGVEYNAMEGRLEDEDGGYLLQQGAHVWAAQDYDPHYHDEIKIEAGDELLIIAKDIGGQFLRVKRLKTGATGLVPRGMILSKQVGAGVGQGGKDGNGHGGGLEAIAGARASHWHPGSPRCPALFKFRTISSPSIALLLRPTDRRPHRPPEVR